MEGILDQDRLRDSPSLGLCESVLPWRVFPVIRVAHLTQSCMLMVGRGRCVQAPCFPGCTTASSRKAWGSPPEAEGTGEISRLGLSTMG